MLDGNRGRKWQRERAIPRREEGQRRAVGKEKKRDERRTKQEFRLKFRNVRPRMRTRGNEWMLQVYCTVHNDAIGIHAAERDSPRRHNFAMCTARYLRARRSPCFIAIKGSSCTITHVRLRTAHCDCHVLPIKDYLRLNSEL